jgi:hypothetical protein
MPFRPLAFGCLVLLAAMVLLPATGVVQELEERALLVSRGTAVVGDSIAEAREEAIQDALKMALETYIFARLGAGQGQEGLIRDTILEHRERYILSYELQRSHMLGDIYQVEVNTYLHAGLLQADLSELLTPTRQAVNRIALVVTAAPSSGYQEMPSDPLESLVTDLERELTVYGFKTKVIGGALAAAIHDIFAAPAGDLAFAAAVPEPPPVAALDAELVVLIIVDPVRTEEISTVERIILTGGFELFFADYINQLTNRFSNHDIRVVAADLNDGRQRLTARLAELLNDRVMQHLLREYAVFPAESRDFIVSLQGFRQVADFRQFRAALEALRTVKATAIDRLTAGCIDLRVTTFATAEMLVDWLDGYRATSGMRCRAALEKGDGGRILTAIWYEPAASP